MKNITVSVDDEVYHQARVMAANNRTSVSAMVSEFLTKTCAEPSESFHSRLTAAIAELDATDRRLLVSENVPRDELYDRG